MSEDLRNEGQGEEDSALREEVAQLRQRVERLEAWQNWALGGRPSAGQGEARPDAGSAAEPTSVQGTPVPAAVEASLETTIGSQWLSRIGALAVLVAVALFLKLAIDNHWIGPMARIVLGLVGGLVIVVGSEPFRRRGYRGFSLSLKGLGTGVLYLSLWASFSLYHLLPGAVAGLGMVVVTVSNGLLALKQNSLVLAVYAIVGGLLTPFLLSTSHEHEVALFAYLLLLTAGACVLALLRVWNSLLLLAFTGSGLYALVWAFSWYRAGELTVTVIFAAIGFLLFALIPFAPGSKPPRSASHTALSIANAMGGVVLAMALFTGQDRVVAILGIAVFYYLLPGLRRDSQDLPLAGWTVVLNGNFALLVGVTLWIHRLWYRSAGAIGPHTGEQLSYSFWFMGFGALLVILGFWRSRAALRWQGLALLLASITKVFLIDMTFLSQGLRVFSFLGLGLLLLLVSFVYQRDWLKLRGRG